MTPRCAVSSTLLRVHAPIDSASIAAGLLAGSYLCFVNRQPAVADNFLGPDTDIVHIIPANQAHPLEAYARLTTLPAGSSSPACSATAGAMFAGSCPSGSCSAPAAGLSVSSSSILTGHRTNFCSAQTSHSWDEKRCVFEAISQAAPGRIKPSGRVLKFPLPSLQRPQVVLTRLQLWVPFKIFVVNFRPVGSRIYTIDLRLLKPLITFFQPDGAPFPFTQAEGLDVFMEGSRLLESHCETITLRPRADPAATAYEVTHPLLTVPASSSSARRPPTSPIPADENVRSGR